MKSKELSYKVCRPLGLNPWNRMGDTLSRYESECRFIDELKCEESAKRVLMGELAYGCMRNCHADELQQNQDSDYVNAALKGDLPPHDMVALMHGNPGIPSAELGRYIHPGEWDTADAIDTPIRTTLETSEDLKTEKLDDESYYKITNTSIAEPGNERRYIGISRKRAIYAHYGGSILTIVKNQLLIDRDSSQIPEPLQSELEACTNSKAIKTFNYDEHRKFLSENIENFIRSENKDNVPEGIMPLSTVYYAARKDARKSSNVREGKARD